MPQFDRLRILGKPIQKFPQPVSRRIVTVKTCRELEEKASESARRRNRRDAFFESRDVRRQNRLAVVCELLPRLDRELEFRRRASNPSFCRFGSAWAIESGVHFDGIEIPRVELQFVNFF